MPGLPGQCFVADTIRLINFQSSEFWTQFLSLVLPLLSVQVAFDRDPAWLAHDNILSCATTPWFSKQQSHKIKMSSGVVTKTTDPTVIINFLTFLFQGSPSDPFNNITTQSIFGSTRVPSTKNCIPNPGKDKTLLDATLFAECINETNM